MDVISSTAAAAALFSSLLLPPSMAANAKAVVFAAMSTTSTSTSSPPPPPLSPRLLNRPPHQPPDVVLCPLNEYIDDNDETVQEFFECPGLEDPPNHRLCCQEKCCAILDSVLQVDIRIAMVISLSVICACVVAGVVLVVCCFASSCPMYDTCAGSWGSQKEAGLCNGHVGIGYIPGDMHPLMLNGGGGTANSNGKGHHHHLLDRKSHRVAEGIPPIKVVEADHV